MKPPRRDRRRFLRSALAGGLTAGALAPVRNTPAGEDEGTWLPAWMMAPGAPIVSPPYGAPAAADAGVPGGRLQRHPWQDLHGVITPNGLHFERHHSGVPAIDPQQHRLLLHGLVGRPLAFTMDDLVRFPAVSRIHFLECSGNTPWTAEEGWTVQDTHGLLSCAEWTGCHCPPSWRRRV